MFYRQVQSAKKRPRIIDMAIETRFSRLAVEDYHLPQDWTRRLCSPSLVVYLDRVRENLRRILDATGGPERWRPHVKTTKIPEVYAELVNSGVRQFKCATVREAETLMRVVERKGSAAADILLAYPLVGPNLERLGELARSHANSVFSVLCEDPDAVGGIPPELGIFVDVNPGMHRTGIPLAHAGEISGVALQAGGRFRGVHFYDGQIQGATAGERREAAHRGYAALMELVGSLQARTPVGEIVTSGTPAFRYALDFDPFSALSSTVHRVSPGTVVFHDLRSEQDHDDLDLLPAAVVFSRVVSHPRPGHFTCDAGSKSIAAEAGDPCAFALGHPGAEALTPSEEHLPFRTTGDCPPRGAELYLVPRHVCPTVNLAEQALLVDGDRIEVGRVAARAHDLLIERRTGR